MKIIKWLGLSLSVAVASLAVVYFFFPAVVLDVVRNYERQAAGLELGVTQVGDFDIHYLSGGDGPTIVMLHGFGGEKTAWVPMATRLTQGYRVIAIDLPGFGESSRLVDERYDVSTQIDRVEAVAVALGLENFHIVGNSMGGWIAAGYSHRYPQRVLSLAVLDAGGVDQPNPSDFYVAFNDGDNQLLVNSAEDFDRVINNTFVNPPTIPGPIKAYLSQESMSRAAFNKRVGEQLLEFPFPLEPLLPDITQPALVLWGDTDLIIDVSAADVFESLLPNASKVILTNTGHVPMMEKPAETTTVYLDFLAKAFNGG